jgi:riboflavin kinase/FMN adenylyltransferase
MTASKSPWRGNPSVLAVYRRLEELPPGFGPTALTIGNFDGVHVGHARILREVVLAAQAGGLTPAALTFDPHPARVVAPDRAPRLLTTLEQRLPQFEAAGVQAVLVLPFTLEIARLSPEDFVRRVLVEKLAARLVVVGENFRFGHRQAGNVESLQGLGRTCGFEVRTVPPVAHRGERVSSSRVRQLVSEGQVARAAGLLGRPFSLEGRVIHGHGVGASQTVPTLNLAPDTEVLPARGVYVTCAEDAGSARRWPAVTNVGYRPTFEGTDLSIETFLLRPAGGPDPARLRLSFWRRLRDEKKFDSPETLRRQILRDAAQAEKFFRRLHAAQPLKETVL